MLNDAIKLSLLGRFLVSSLSVLYSYSRWTRTSECKELFREGRKYLSVAKHYALTKVDNALIELDAL